MQTIVKELIDGDKWYAITKKWFDKFAHFAYLDDDNNNDNDKDNERLIEFAKENNRPYPPKMNNSELKRNDNTFELKKELNENEHFVWICHELYEYF